VIVTIARTELRRMFASVLAWSILALVVLVLGLLFSVYVETFLTVIQPRLAAQPGAPGVTDSVVAPLILMAGVLMLVVSPLLTMRSLSEERQTGTFVLLRSSPVSATQIVLGKYLGLLGFLAVLMAILALFPAALALGTALDWGKAGAGMLGLFLLIGSFLAAGLYVSSLTAVPTLAALGSF